MQPMLGQNKRMPRHLFRLQKWQFVLENVHTIIFCYLVTFLSFLKILCVSSHLISVFDWLDKHFDLLCCFKLSIKRLLHLLHPSVF